ncbi:hypothetical protein H072_8325 [Dactylellina haptotyla CBS 200.50]|uniref:Receptor L-domain domain-containing protein n=1 Tax=Dactylellina haptotyla (strain CBS 200.50) TaxID=1284197 RepID=S8A4N3_DACHA|nr:hypothetical protein H072_8325 [Dactylellina haptotyla CBS 200.50]
MKLINFTDSRCSLIAFAAVSTLSQQALAQNDCGDLTNIQTAASSCVRAADVTISTSATFPTLNLANIRNIQGDFDVRGSNLQSVVANSLSSITGDFTIICSKLTELSIPKLSNLTGDLYFELSDSPFSDPTLALASISVDSDFSFVKSPNIQRISLNVSPAPPDGNRTLTIGELYALNTLQVTGVKFATVDISTAPLSTLPDVWLENANLIRLASLGALSNISISTKTLGSGIIISGIGSPVVQFIALTSLDGDFDFIQTETSSLLLPELQTIGRGLTISLNTNLASLSLPKITTITDLAVANNSALLDVSFDSLATVGTIAFLGNDYLTTIDLAAWFPRLSQVTRYIVVAGAFSNITFPDLQGGVGIKAPSITLTSSVEIDCDAIKSEAVSKQAVQDISNLQCSSGPKGSRPTVTETRPASSATGSTSNTTPSDVGSNEGSHKNVGAIAGGVVGGVVLLAIITLIIWYYRRRPAPVVPTGPGSTIPSHGKVGGIEDDIGGIEDGGHGAGGINTNTS